MKWKPNFPKWILFFSGIDIQKINSYMSEKKLSKQQVIKLKKSLKGRSHSDVYRSWNSFNYRKRFADYFMSFFSQRYLDKNDVYLLMPEDKLTVLCPDFEFEEMQELCNTFGFRAYCLMYYVINHHAKEVPSAELITQEELDKLCDEFRIEQLTVGDVVACIRLFRNKKMGNKCFWHPLY